MRSLVIITKSDAQTVSLTNEEVMLLINILINGQNDHRSFVRLSMFLVFDIDHSLTNAMLKILRDVTRIINM